MFLRATWETFRSSSKGEGKGTYTCNAYARPGKIRREGGGGVGSPQYRTRLASMLIREGQNWSGKIM